MFYAILMIFWCNIWFPVSFITQYYSLVHMPRKLNKIAICNVIPLISSQGVSRAVLQHWCNIQNTDLV